MTAGTSTGRAGTVRPVIRTQRLLLRSFEHEDLEGFAAVLADPQVMAPFGGPLDLRGARIALDDYLAHERRHGFAPFAVVLDDEIVGDVGLKLLEDGPEVELLYRLLPSVWGRGLATEACDAALQFGFTELGLDRIVLVIDDDNVASKRLAQRLGFERHHSGMYYGHPLVLYRIDPAKHAQAVAERRS
jgi:RimJ/RimL family protein N-acetyltransferase